MTGPARRPVRHLTKHHPDGEGCAVCFIEADLTARGIELMTAVPPSPAATATTAQEPTMTTTRDLPTRFATLADALAAGYRRCGHRYGDRDISDHDSVGYDYQALDGRTSVTVRLTEARNAGGGVGATLALMPPSPSLTEDEEVAAADALRTAAAEQNFLL